MTDKTANTQRDSKQAIPSPEDRVRALCDWLEDEAIERMKHAMSREESARSMRGATAKDLRDAKVLAEKMAGRRLHGVNTSPEHAALEAEAQDRIATKLATEARQLSAWASLVEELKGQAAELEGSREHTWEWITRHYGKLQDWARTVLPEPWSTQFFNCIANGLYDPIKDVGKTYICNAGFEVTPGGYFKMPTAEYQLLCDQMKRAEAAETEVALLTKRKDYHAEYVEAVEAAEKAQGERDEYKRQWNDVLAHEDRALARGRELERGLGVMREALRRIGDPAAKVDSLMEARMIARAALTPEPATKAEVQK